MLTNITLSKSDFDIPTNENYFSEISQLQIIQFGNKW